MKNRILRRQSIILALITAPLLAIMAATPIFILSGNDMGLLPTVWLIGTVACLLCWTVNIGLAWRWLEWQIFRYAVSFLIVITIVVIVRLSYIPPSFVQPIPIIISVLVAISVNVIVLILHELLHLRYTYSHTEKENAVLKIKQIEAQFQLLKNQLKPHFLFNALSTLKTLIKRQPQQAEVYLVQLADFLRASLVLDQKKQIPLQEDMQIALNYLQMQMVRFKDSIIIENRLPKQWDQTYYVPPFTVQLLIENAIKHTVFSPENPLRLTIALQAETGGNWVEVTNNVAAKAQGEPSSKIGLANLSQHFALLGSQPLQIRQTDAFFSVAFQLITTA